MSAEPTKAIVDVLEAAAIGLTSGTNLFEGPKRPPARTRAGTFPVAQESVFCNETGGPTPQSFINGGEGPDLRFHNVQVWVRSKAEGVETGLTLARSVWRALQRATIPDYVMTTVLDSSPVYLGKDDTEHHEWTVNVETVRED